MQHQIDEDLAQALARLESSFRSLAETRDMVGRTLDTALTELARQIDQLDGSREHCDRQSVETEYVDNLPAGAPFPDPVLDAA